jgi:hypothetical protein
MHKQQKESELPPTVLFAHKANNPILAEWIFAMMRCQKPTYSAEPEWVWNKHNKTRMWYQKIKAVIIDFTKTAYVNSIKGRPQQNI